jgi:hypothetical protein
MDREWERRNNQIGVVGPNRPGKSGEYYPLTAEIENALLAGGMALGGTNGKYRPKHDRRLGYPAAGYAAAR